MTRNKHSHGFTNTIGVPIRANTGWRNVLFLDYNSDACQLRMGILPLGSDIVSDFGRNNNVVC